MQRFRQCCALTLIALAPLALVSTASAAFTNRSASSGEMTMSGDAYYGSSAVVDTALSALPSVWANSNSQWNLEQTSNPNHPLWNPRLNFNSWQDTSVSAWAKTATVGTLNWKINWSIPSLTLDFGVIEPDTIQIVTQQYGSFSANFQIQNASSGAWTSLGTWSNLGATKLFNVVEGTSYRFQLLNASDVNAGNDTIFAMHLASGGGGSPAPGALALIGIAGIFGGRRRR